MRVWAVLVWLATCGAALAQGAPLPALYDVARVAASDVLNVREGPGAGSAILATLAPDRRGVEIVEISADGKWGRLNAGERSGWAALAYLDRQAGQEEGFPAIRSCTGTEPFWGLWQEDAGWLYSSPDGPDHSLSESWRAPASGRIDRYGLALAWEDISARAVIRRELCSDGMTDRAFGLSVDVILTEAGETRLVTGCCRLSAD